MCRRRVRRSREGEERAEERRREGERREGQNVEEAVMTFLPSDSISPLLTPTDVFSSPSLYHSLKCFFPLPHPQGRPNAPSTPAAAAAAGELLLLLLALLLLLPLQLPAFSLCHVSFSCSSLPMFGPSGQDTQTNGRKSKQVLNEWCKCE